MVEKIDCEYGPTEQFYNIHKLANHFTHGPTIIYKFLNDRLIWKYCEFYCVLRLLQKDVRKINNCRVISN